MMSNSSGRGEAKHVVCGTENFPSFKAYTNEYSIELTHNPLEDAVSACFNAMKCKRTTFLPFIVVDAPSGSGKTLHGLDLVRRLGSETRFGVYLCCAKVGYYSQGVYQAFKDLSNPVLEAVNTDLASTKACNASDISTEDSVTAAMLFQLFELMQEEYKESPIERLHRISWKGSQLFTKKRVGEVAEEIRKKKWQPVVVLDECQVANANDAASARVRFLRDLLRCMGCVPVLMGTNAKLATWQERRQTNSRGASYKLRCRQCDVKAQHFPECKVGRAWSVLISELPEITNPADISLNKANGESIAPNDESGESKSQNDGNGELNGEEAAKTEMGNFLFTENANPLLLKLFQEDAPGNNHNLYEKFRIICQAMYLCKFCGWGRWTSLAQAALLSGGPHPLNRMCVQKHLARLPRGSYKRVNGSVTRHLFALSTILVDKDRKEVVVETMTSSMPSFVEDPLLRLSLARLPFRAKRTARQVMESSVTWANDNDGTKNHDVLKLSGDALELTVTGCGVAASAHHKEQGGQSVPQFMLSLFRELGKTLHTFKWAADVDGGCMKEWQAAVQDIIVPQWVFVTQNDLPGYTEMEEKWGDFRVGKVMRVPDRMQVDGVADLLQESKNDSGGTGISRLSGACRFEMKNHEKPVGGDKLEKICKKLTSTKHCKDPMRVWFIVAKKLSNAQKREAKVEVNASENDDGTMNGTESSSTNRNVKQGGCNVYLLSFDKPQVVADDENKQRPVDRCVLVSTKPHPRFAASENPKSVIFVLSLDSLDNSLDPKKG